MFQTKIKTTICSVIALIVLYACSSTKPGQSSTDRLFEEGEYETLINDLKKKPETAATTFKIAECYRLSNRPLLAQTYYEKSLSLGNKARDIQYHLAYGKKMQGDYTGAKSQLEKYLKLDSLNPNYIVAAKKEIINLGKLDSLKNVKSFYEIKPVEGLNTKGTEFGPMMYNGELVFTASRKPDIYTANNLPLLGLYKTQMLTTLQAAKVDKFSQSVFDESVNEGTITFNKDGNVAVFAKGNTGKKKGSLDVDLYVSSKDAAGQWKPAEILSISDSTAWDSCPAFSADGRTLYFASNRDGGIGGIDIYRVAMDAAGRFGTPQNMGRTINTPGDDMFPYVGKDGRLFFASDGHAGFGGLDLFVATRKNNQIEIENLGIPMNSRFDDFALTKFENKKGYFSSNREGGQGDDDIYYFEDTSPEPEPVIAKKDEPPVVKKDEPKVPKVVKYSLAGNIINNKGVALDSVKVQLIDINTNLMSAEAETVEDGKYGKFELETDAEYSILIQRPGYFTKRIPFNMLEKVIPEEKLTKAFTDTTFYLTTVLEKPALNQVVNNFFSVNPIYYDLNKSNIRLDAANELDKIVQALEDNPTVKIELGSHTDSRSSDEYNLALSQRRAESAVQYIISKGISEDRIRAKGYGETQLTNRCANGVECTEEEHQANRRTEFKVIEIK